MRKNAREKDEKCKNKNLFVKERERGGRGEKERKEIELDVLKHGCIVALTHRDVQTRTYIHNTRYSSPKKKYSTHKRRIPSR